MVLCGESPTFPKNAPQRLKRPTDILFLAAFVFAIILSWSITETAKNHTDFRPYLWKGADSFGNVCGEPAKDTADMYYKLEGVITKGNGSNVNGAGFDISVPYFNMGRSNNTFEMSTGLAKSALKLIGARSSGDARSSDANYSPPEDIKICVDACPGSDFPESFFTQDNIAKLAGVIVLSDSNKGAFKATVDAVFTNSTEADLIKDNLWCEDILVAQGYGQSQAVLDTCADKTVLMPMSSVVGRCMPHRSILSELLASANQTAAEGGASAGFASKIVTGATEAFTSAQQTTATFRKELINTIAVCVVVSLLVILIVQVFTKYIVMILVLGFFFTSLGAIYFVWASFLSAFEPDAYASMCQLGSIEICEVLTGNQTASAADIQSKQRIAYGVTFVCGLVVLTICCCWNNIRLAVQLFDEAGRCVFSMPFLLLQPVYTFLVSVICVWIFKAQLYYTTSVNVAVIDVDGIDAGTPVDINFKGPSDYWQYICWFIVLVILWIVYFVAGVHQVTLAGAVQEWYWTKVTRRMAIFPQGHAFITTVLCNLGSIALGSFLIALVNTIRLMIYVIERANKKATDESKIMQYIMKIIHCCLWCVEKFLQFINRNAYIGIAIFGYNFCRAARTSLSLKIENAGGALIVTTICSFVLFLAKIIAVGASCFAFNFYCEAERASQYAALDMPQKTVLFLIVAIMAYIICSIFLSVYEMALDTIFLCFCEDQRRNKGTADSPYAASARLQKFMSRNI